MTMTMTATGDIATRTVVAGQQPNSLSTAATATDSQVGLSTISNTAAYPSITTVTVTVLPGTCPPQSSSTTTPYYPNYGSSSTCQFPPPSGTGYVPPPMITLTAGGTTISKLDRGTPAVVGAGFVVLFSFVLS